MRRALNSMLNREAAAYGSQLGGRDDDNDILSPFPYQRVARGGEFVELLRVAAGVGMRGLGGAFVGLLDFGAEQAAAERQAEQLPMTFFGRKRPHAGTALAETRGV